MFYGLCFTTPYYTDVPVLAVLKNVQYIVPEKNSVGFCIKQ